jgi:maltooligosyltrehalose trehalohydrolase
MLFQGEEWGSTTPFQYFTDHRDRALGTAVSAGRRREFAHFGWTPDEVPDPQANATYQRSRLDWGERDRSPHSDMLQWYRTLITLRRTRPALADPRLDRIGVEYDDDAQTLVVIRDEVRVLVNLGTEPHCFTITDGVEIVAASDAAVDQVNTSVRVPPDAVAIVAMRNG